MRHNQPCYPGLRKKSSARAYSQSVENSVSHYTIKNVIKEKKWGDCFCTFESILRLLKTVLERKFCKKSTTYIFFHMVPSNKEANGLRKT